MAKYSDIKGFTVQTLSSDTAASAADAGSWASGTDLNTNKFSSGSGGTANNSAIVFGGFAPSASALTEQYNGSSWTEVNDLNTARGGGAGIGNDSITANLFVGSGSPTPVSAQNESWNGTSWTEVNDLNAGKQYLSSGGTQTSGIIFGGRTNPSSPTGQTETWDGTSWTEVNDMNSARLSASGVGTQTAALNIGGLPSPGNPSSNLVESWNGSSWTEITEVNTGRQQGGSAGEQTDALLFGGYVNPPISANTEFWNGTSWTELADLSVARYGISKGSIGTSATSLAAGGYTTDYVATTEEWSAPSSFNQIHEGQLFFNSTTNTFKETILDVPGGTWASNTAAPTASTERWGAGTSNSNALIGAPPGVAMEWNGSSWTDGGTVNSNNQGRGGTGGITAALIWGGTSSPAVTEQYNGTAWTEVNDLNQGGSSQPTGPTGTYTDLISAGRGPGFSGVSESWDGTSWTETADLSTARRSLGSSGASSTDCAVFGGTTPPNNNIAKTEQWNGTAWTETGDLNTSRGSGMGFGVSSQTLAYVGGTSYPASPPYNTKTEAFNGSSWTEVNDLPNGRYHNKGGGSAASALTAGGYLASPAGGQTTENLIWEANLANKTITAS